MKGLVRHGPEQPFDVEYGPAEPGFDPAAMVPENGRKVLSLVDEHALTESSPSLFTTPPWPSTGL